jgi:RNA polymerase sigma factor (sigma-70 family)
MNRQRERFWELLQPQFAPAQVFCRKLTGDRDTGDDLFQDALITALRKFSTLRDEESFRPWLYRIIVRTFVSTVRSPWWKRRVRLTEDMPVAALRFDPTNRHAARRWLEKAFGALSPDDRALVALFELEEWTLAELAEVYGKSEGALKLRLFRARRKMKKVLLAYLKQTESERETTDADEGAAQCGVVRPNPD